MFSRSLNTVFSGTLQKIKSLESSLCLCSDRQTENGTCLPGTLPHSVETPGAPATGWSSDVCRGRNTNLIKCKAMTRSHFVGYVPVTLPDCCRGIDGVQAHSKWLEKNYGATPPSLSAYPLQLDRQKRVTDTYITLLCRGIPTLLLPPCSLS